MLQGISRADMFVGRNLRCRRLASNLSLADAAAALGKPIDYVLAMESGRVRPAAVELFYLVKLLDCSLAELFADGRDEVVGPPRKNGPAS